MKKISILLCLLVLSVTKIFALSDIQVGYSAGSYTNQNWTYNEFVIANHNYLNESNTFGICESLSFSPFTIAGSLYENSFMLTAFIGPTMRVPLASMSTFNMSAGFRYVLDYKSRTVPYVGLSTGETINVDDLRVFTAYCFSVDFQWELSINDRVAVLTGFPLSYGMGRERYEQKPTSTNPKSSYRKMVDLEDFSQFVMLGPFYVSISYKF